MFYHNIPNTRWNNDGTKPCPQPNMHWREMTLLKGLHMERGCSWCGWTEPKEKEKHYGNYP